jgi:hypothetical protein
MEMSSLIQWPSIYGTTYFVPAVVVVVLLLALLLLMSSRRRLALETARGAAQPFEDEETPAPAAPPEDVAAEATAAPADEANVMVTVTQPAAAMATVALSSEAAPAPLTAAPAVLPVAATAARPQEPAPPASDFRRVASGRNARVTVRTQGPVAGGIDPLTTALLGILAGWGDLTPEDMKRLELFRPERLAAALAVIQLPKSSSGDAKARLSQLRQYSADLDRKALAAQVAAAAAAQPAIVPPPDAVPAAAAPTTAATTVTAPARMASGGAFAAAYSDPAPSDHVPSQAAATTLAAAVALGTATRADSDSAPAPSTQAEPETAALVAGAVALTPAVTPNPSDGPPPGSEIEELASFWAAPRSLWDPDGEVPFEELPAPSYEEIAIRHEIRPEASTKAIPNGNGGNGDGPSLKEVAPVPPAPLAGAASAGAAMTSAHDFFRDDGPADPLSRLSIKVETAEQLLALPPEERADMTAFLGPSELAATFRATEDPQLKKAVIDTLEHIGSPASLNALGNCFEDGDCDVQLYALQAADRLLGVA